MTSVDETVAAIVGATDWNERVEAVRRIPERHGKQEQQAVYSAVAEKLYRPHLSANFAFIPRRTHYELETFSEAYRRAVAATEPSLTASVGSGSMMLSHRSSSTATAGSSRWRPCLRCWRFSRFRGSAARADQIRGFCRSITV